MILHRSNVSQTYLPIQWYFPNFSTSKHYFPVLCIVWLRSNLLPRVISYQKFRKKSWQQEVCAKVLFSSKIAFFDKICLCGFRRLKCKIVVSTFESTKLSYFHWISTGDKQIYLIWEYAKIFVLLHTELVFTFSQVFEEMKLSTFFLSWFGPFQVPYLEQHLMDQVLSPAD